MEAQLLHRWSHLQVLLMSCCILSRHCSQDHVAKATPLTLSQRPCMHLSQPLPTCSALAIKEALETLTGTWCVVQGGG